MTQAVNMADFIAAKSDQLNADDLMDAPRTVTITKVTASPDAAEQPVSIHYEGDSGKPFKPCKTMRRILVGVWGKDASKYVGRSMTLYRDATVAFGGLQVGGIRISHMSDIAEDKTVALLVTRGRKAPFKIKPLLNAPDRAQSSDYSGQLTELRALAQPGNMDALGAKWQEIGADARKALAAELPSLKAACAAPTEDVPFDASAEGNAPASEATPEPSAESSSTESGETLPTSTTATTDASPSDEKTPAEEAVEKVIAAMDEAKTPAALAKLVKDAEPHKSFMPNHLAVRLEIAADRNRQRLEPATEGAK